MMFISLIYSFFLLNHYLYRFSRSGIPFLSKYFTPLITSSSPNPNQNTSQFYSSLIPADRCRSSFTFIKTVMPRLIMGYTMSRALVSGISNYESSWAKWFHIAFNKLYSFIFNSCVRVAVPLCLCDHNGWAFGLLCLFGFSAWRSCTLFCTSCSFCSIFV